MQSCICEKWSLTLFNPLCRQPKGRNCEQRQGRSQQTRWGRMKSPLYTGQWGYSIWLDNGSRMNREIQVRFWESLGVKSPWATHQPEAKKNTTSRHSELVSESRCFFPVTRSLSLGERTTIQRPASSFALSNPYPLPLIPVSHKPRSRNKFGMTTLDYRDKLAFRHAELVSASRLSFLVKGH